MQQHLSKPSVQQQPQPQPQPQPLLLAESGLAQTALADAPALLTIVPLAVDSQKAPMLAVRSQKRMKGPDGRIVGLKRVLTWERACSEEDVKDKLLHVWSELDGEAGMQEIFLGSAMRWFPLRVYF